MTDFNYFDDWGLEGGWDTIQNPDYSSLWDSFNTGYQAQVPIFPQDNSYWETQQPLDFGGNITGYNYTQNDFPGASAQVPQFPQDNSYWNVDSINNAMSVAAGQAQPTSSPNTVPIEERSTQAQPSWLRSVGDFASKNKDLLRMIGAGYGAYKQGKAADMQRGLAKQMMSQFDNPYRKEYAAQHFNYAQNPGEFFNSPVVQAQYQKAMDQYMRQMAAQGRTNPNEIGLTSANMLNDIVSKTYMPWMQTSYPWGQANQNLIGPYSQLMNQANISEYNQYNDLLKWLYTMSGIPQENIGITQRKDNDPYAAALQQLLGF